MFKLMNTLCMVLALLVATPMQAGQANSSLSEEDARMCLAQSMFFESRGEPEAGKIAVAIVFQNRAEEKMWGDTHVCQAIYRPMQSSYANVWPKGVRVRMQLAQGKVEATIANDAIEAAAYAQALELAGAILANASEVKAVRDRLSGADHFKTPTVFPKWADPKKMVAMIGGHQFYDLLG